MENGELFRAMRRNHRITLAQVADEQNSVATISKFERGISDIGLSRFLHLLNRIDTSMEEFLFRKALADGHAVMNPRGEHDFNSQIDVNFEHRVSELGDMTTREVTGDEIATLQAEIELWEHPLDHTPTHRERFSALVLRFYELTLLANRRHYQQGRHPDQVGLGRLSGELNDLVRPFVSYLRHVERWGYFELYFFGLLHTGIDNETEHELLPLALKRSRMDKGFNSVSTMRFWMLFGAFTDFINARQFQWAREALDRAEQDLQTEHNLNMANLLLFCRGWYRIIHDDVDAGTKLCQQAISIEHILKQDNQGVGDLANVLPYVLANRDNPGSGAYFM
ncbi:Rgg/GadR/MutR family transcriptional regulator [Lacticaseibacillus pantheris]|uniref:Rgg/GadR/MutR family transcriptional regulator n=1 Tax=Lacticaseibacillus pantheris TaxID=171523 RepID=UPI00265852AB|nr:Rgg/GadR/MutR family transcriptional regulator [Lacticaseibacillus pantheris]WKF84333.1 hypothetical protein QY874_08550 [Lacticaseibacillus pantheris]